MNRSEKDLIDEIEDNGPGHISGLSKRINRSKSTVHRAVKKLEQEKKVKRYYSSEKNKVLVGLSEETISTTNKTIRHLQNSAPASQIDAEKGRELITEEVKETVLEISNLYWSSKTQEIESKLARLEKKEGKKEDDPPFIETDFCETVLLSALARYNFENKQAPHDEGSDSFSLYIPFSQLAEVFPHVQHVRMTVEEYDEWLLGNALPVIKILREKNLLEKFDELLLWVRPLIQSEEMKDYFEEKGNLWNEVSPTRENLVAKVFEKEQREYYWVLEPFWKKKVEELSTLPQPGEENFGRIRGGYYEKVDEYPEDEKKISILEKKGLTPPKDLKKDFEKQLKKSNPEKAWEKVNFRERYEKHLAKNGLEVGSILDSLISGKEIRLIGKRKDPPAPRFVLMDHLKNDYVYDFSDSVFPDLEKAKEES